MGSILSHTRNKKGAFAAEGIYQLSDQGVEVGRELRSFSLHSTLKVGSSFLGKDAE